MKKYTPLLGAASLSFTLSSCYMPPGAYYPPGGGTPPGGGITPPGGGIVPTPKKYEIDSYRITGIRIYQLPKRKSGSIPWDPSLGNTRNPDVFAVLKSNGRTIGTSVTRHDHSPRNSTYLTVNSSSMNFDRHRRVHVGLFDRDRSNSDEIGGYNITVPTPASRQTRAKKTVKYRNSNGDLYYVVDFSYTWVLR
ncbi:hypothetical protein JIN77_08050 [Verrucomicrobiaceae bacterium R5-34]|uniref:Lipoprotein n=1 Tax=Oceaniferula flava TaxID=2800421 RepID=A0AAE2SFA5_9BACT|nr:hypothetical protein [Oceaniferula flavus]MBK1830675.1 hypothetical protein [Verrucomicrobiaceae bacterium R5-34]MBK1855932.1 hypothetical protein [Oceaniferula flavus]MBM1137239.1 hypothetical protein [Oceaniferula flavus]